MKILLTGGRGMVGRNILEQAEKRGAEVHAPTSEVLDLTNAAKTAEFVQSLQPSIIVLPQDGSAEFRPIFVNLFVF